MGSYLPTSVIVQLDITLSSLIFTLDVSSDTRTREVLSTVDISGSTKALDFM